ncbi:Ras suppressor protein 1 [Fasciola hepatica]|uniref:Ras suppressor protein 1 n=1 Tax=Fasciola hepatica TaxID=6192 RepID=A0A4E0QW71_FASHE|nr:Ras suppressor protein 1 [Fasciola hepatica]
MLAGRLKNFRKGIEDVREGKENSLSAIRKELTSIPYLPELEIPQEISTLQCLEHLNLFNNCITTISPKIVELSYLRFLNLGMNKLTVLPRGFGAFPSLEILDLTYNNLSENSLPENFFNLVTLRALYLSDNDFEQLPGAIGKLVNLEILALRDNDLIMLPAEIGQLTRLKELHLQGNRLSVLPPELGNLDLCGPKQVTKLYGNPWVTPIENQLQVNISHVFDYIRSETYKFLFDRQVAANHPPPPVADKSKKISRKPH